MVAYNEAMSAISLEEAVRRLRLFNEKAEILLEKRSFLEKVSAENAGFQLKWSDSVVTMRRIGADDEATDAFVTTFRMFIQPRDNISISQTLELYDQLDVPPEVKVWAKEFREDYDRFRQQHGPVAKIVIQKTRQGPDGEPIVVEEEILTNELVLETFIYGDIAHTNDDKRKRFQHWKSLPQFPMIQNQFEQAAENTCRYIGMLRGNNDYYLRTLQASEKS